MKIHSFSGFGIIWDSITEFIIFTSNGIISGSMFLWWSDEIPSAPGAFLVFRFLMAVSIYLYVTDGISRFLSFSISSDSSFWVLTSWSRIIPLLGICSKLVPGITSQSILSIHPSIMLISLSISMSLKIKVLVMFLPPFIRRACTSLMKSLQSLVDAVIRT